MELQYKAAGHFRCLGQWRFRLYPSRLRQSVFS